MLLAAELRIHCTESSISSILCYSFCLLYSVIILLIVPNEALVGGIIGGLFIVIIMTVAAIGGLFAYFKKKLQANVVINL